MIIAKAQAMKRCPECGGRLRLIAMVKTQATIQEILKGMGLPQSSPGPPKRSELESSEPKAKELDWGDGDTSESDNSDADTNEMMGWPEYPE